MLWLLWLIVATHVFAYVWSSHLDLFPQWPEAVGRWIARLTGTADSEDIEQLTLYYMLTISFITVAIITLMFLLAARWIGNGRNAAMARRNARPCTHPGTEDPAPPDTPGRD